eukprot:11536151-Heterocapsa_arctica.AAC.2
MIPSSISGDSDTLFCIEPRSGDLQGDPSAAQKYTLAMDPAIARLVESSMTFCEERPLHFQLPGSAQEYNPSYVTYADDVATLNSAHTAAHAVWMLHEQDASLDRE